MECWLVVVAVQWQQQRDGPGVTVQPERDLPGGNGLASSSGTVWTRLATCSTSRAQAAEQVALAERDPHTATRRAHPQVADALSEQPRVDAAAELA